MKTLYALLVTVLILVSTNYASAQSQTEVILLLDAKGREVESIKDAHYFEKLVYNSSGEGTKETYLAEDSSKVSLYTYSDLFGGQFKRGVLHGPYYSWYKNGNRQSSANYTNGKLDGSYERWYENGQLNYTLKYRDGLKHDTLKAYHETGELRRIEVYSLGKLVDGKLYSEAGEELNFYPMEQMPEFKGGEERMMQWLAQNIRYPRAAIRVGAQGIVVVSFVVDKDGKISEAEIIESVHPDIDTEAIRVMYYMPKWKPGMQEGKPVRVRYTLPLKFAFK